MPITTLPAAPNRSTDDASTFSTKADAFIAALATFVNEANALEANTQAGALTGSSTSSQTIGTGSQSYTTQTGKAWLAGTVLLIVSTASPANYMLATVTSYTSGTGALVVNVTEFSGSGTFASWALATAKPATQNPQVSSQNGGALAGFRSRVINGGMQVGQRAAVPLANALQYGQADCMLFAISGGTGISGNSVIAANSGFVSGYCAVISTASWTNGIAQMVHRIEARNVQDFASKTVTVSLRVAQDTGASRTFNIALQKANTIDNFTAVTTVGTPVNSGAVASGAVTQLVATFTLGAADAANGLQIVVQDTASNTVTAKNYYFGDLQIEIGAVNTPFEARPFGLEYSMCRRYGRPLAGLIPGQVFTATSGTVTLFLDQPFRAAPTLSTTAGFNVTTAGGGSAAATPAVSSLFDSMLRIDFSGASALTAGNATFLLPPANAFLSAGL